MWVSFEGDRFLGVILTYVVVHLLDAQRTIILVVAREPEARRAIVVVVGNVEVVRACRYENVVVIGDGCC